MATFDINDVARRVQYISTGQDGPYAFNFQVNQASELLVYRNDTAQTDSLQYNATIGGDGTGSITFIDNSGGGGEDYTPVNGDVITIIGDQALGRTTAFTTGQISVANTLETEFDNVVIRQQQIKEITDRSIQLKPSTGRTVTGSGTSGPLYFPYDTTVANNVNRILKYDSNGTSLELGSTSTNIDALAAIASDITTVSGISSNVTTVAGMSSNISTVVSNAANINTVATNIANVNTVAGIDADVTAVAGNETNINAVNANSSNINTVAGNSTNINTVAGISSNVTTVAGLSTEITALSGVSSQDLIDVAALGTELQTLAPIASDITTVAGVSGNVTTVAGISSDVSTVSGISANTTTVAGISGNVTTVAGISSDVSTVAGISANVTTVAGDTANIATVAGNTTNINTVATNITDVNTFANRYRISATDPTTSLDIGDLYYDTTNDIMKVYGSSGWQNAGSSVNGTSARFQYSVSSSTTTITGTDDNGNTLLYDAGYVDVYLNGIKMVNGSDVTVTSGSSVVFASPIGTSGTDTVDIIAYGTFNVAAIDATSITSGTLGYARGGTGLGALGSADEVLQMNVGGTALEYGKVDTANISDDAVTSAKIADNNVGAAELNVSGNGTSGQFLSSDADGSFSWVDAPASGGFSLGTALTGTTPAIDWSSATAFSHTLSGDTTYSFSNVPSGGEIELFLKNVGKQYNLESPTSLSSVSFSEFSSTAHHTVFFNNDGSKMYVAAVTGTYPIYQYSLSTNYDISTKTYDNVFNAGNTISAWGYGAKSFNDDGTKMIVVFDSDLYEYSLTTAYDISTLSTTANHTVSVTSLFRTPVAGTSTPSCRSLKFFADGYGLFIGNETHLLMSGHNVPMAITVTLSTAYDISSTLTLDSYLHEFDFNTLRYFTGEDLLSGGILTSISDDGYVFSILSKSPKTSTEQFSLMKVFLTTPFDFGTAQIASNIQLDLSGITTLYQGEILPSGKTFRYLDSSGRGVSKRLDISGDYTIAFPSATSQVPATIGRGPDPSTTSYIRMVSLDGTNVLITDHKEIV